MSDLRYPVGKFEYQGPLSEAQRSVLIQQIADTPANVRSAITALSETQLGHSLSSRRMDCPPGCAPCPRQSHEFVCALQAGAYRR